MSFSWDVRAVVFDLDGVMVDTEPIFEEAAQRLLAPRGRVLEAEVIRAMRGAPARQGFDFLREFYQLPQSTAELIAEAEELFFAVIGDGTVPLLPGVLKLLEHLERRGIPRAIATSSGRAYLERVLVPHRLLPRFAFALTSDDVRLGKPFPEIYEKAAARLGCDPARVVVLEDSLNGLKAAKAAGTKCIMLPHGLLSGAELAAADAVLPSLEAPQLYELLGLSR
jgi:HAD superfamily hydrolase (TIGR01509 family)